ncbi:stAR-related lipid transfer protein 3-like [Lethenteron reissneri]|uniref:stAR-related lipid transfer protein 3-like n=1 Tax=Lethenteron reissneri TaxID=7753 RepID=UPI002AB7E796|nr:stAR-related lipid transfer protein 3-like [Lethenteron reissneri]XP_061432419.1 stAR-related lipid transfer protein 3-like [Lethenteron reissneri]XP_061432420.1 stAR-related lipid transfer protein 3-like [Lethenteron reissneri]XP_061432421.1 stAR-related lipid transfer protein 3-like [Lethenteron reissneri]XP_061432422.1 stAR-related lipid transfer protein 3-like [Lethenteron reissneri]
MDWTESSLNSSYLVGSADSTPRPENKKISDVRRTFCLFVTFDFLFVGLLWLTELNVDGELKDKLINEVVNYSYQTSLFDIFCLGAVRCTMLLLAYALFRLKHWWMVALTTFVSSAFLIVKVIISQLLKQGALGYVIPIVSFILVWVETWFVDFKVLPQEIKEENRQLQSQLSGSGQAPLIYPRPLSDPHFYSPPSSLAGSDDDSDEDETKKNLTWREKDYVRQGKISMEVMKQTLSRQDLWSFDKKSEYGDVIYITDVTGYGRTYVLKAVLDATPEAVFDEVVVNIEAMPQWNKAITESQVLQRVEDHTFVTYEVAASAARGLISPRDFVTVRRVERRPDRFISSGMSTTHDARPVHDGIVRGENGVGGFVVDRNRHNHEQSVLHWILNTDLKGKLPGYLVQQSLAGVMLDFAENLRKRLRGMRPAV